VQFESLPGLVTAVYSDDNSLQLEGTTQFRMLLSIGNCFRRNATRLLNLPFRTWFASLKPWILNVLSVIVKSEKSPPIEEVIAAGVVPRLVEFLTREDYPQLQVNFIIMPFSSCIYLV
jgi:importin subunit alpha-6/7